MIKAKGYFSCREATQTNFTSIYFLKFHLLGCLYNIPLKDLPDPVCLQIKGRLTFLFQNFIENIMKTIRKIAVIGGTGKSGVYLVKELLSRDYQINLLVRNPDKTPLPSSNLTSITGDVTSENDVNKLLSGSDVVISTLGLGMPVSAPDLFEKASSIILKAMETFGIKRYIVTTGLNVNTPWDQKSEKNLLATTWMEQNFPVSTQSKQKEFELILKSTVEWTLVRLPMIELSEEKRFVETNLKDCIGDKINVRGLVEFLVDQIDSTQFSRKAPFFLR